MPVEGPHGPMMCSNRGPLPRLQVVAYLTECGMCSLDLWPYLLYSKGYSPIGFRAGCHRAKTKMVNYTYCEQLIEFVDDMAPYFLFGTVPTKCLVECPKKAFTESGSSGLVVMGGDSCSKSREFESQHHILNGHFFTYLLKKL